MGESIEDISDEKNGIYLASSRFGITIFDLFSEILQDNDMRHFLRENKIDDTNYNQASLILRCFLLLLDLNRITTDANLKSDVEPEVDEWADSVIVFDEADNSENEICQKRKAGNEISKKSKKRKKSENSKPRTEWKCNMAKCKQSDQVFASRVELEKHKKEFAHFDCSSCSISFHTQAQLRDHLDTDELCKAYTCPNCGQNFRHWTDKTKKKSSTTSKLKGTSG